MNRKNIALGFSLNSEKKLAFEKKITVKTSEIKAPIIISCFAVPANRIQTTSKEINSKTPFFNIKTPYAFIAFINNSK
jgi:hypothetical protein